MNSNHGDLEGRLQRGFDSSAPDLSSDIVTGAAGRRAPRMVNRGRVAQAAAGGVVALAAVTVGAVVLGGTFTQPAPLFEAGGSGGGTFAAAEGAAASDAMIGRWISYEYLPGDALGTEGGSGSVYALERVGAPEAILASLGSQLGIDGAPQQSMYFDETYPSYVVGAEDGSAPSITITWSGTGNWWYSNPSAYPVVCAEPGVIGDDVPEERIAECTEVTPPSSGSAPSEAEARELAAAIFAAGGLSVSAADVTVHSDEWQTTATANLVVGGVLTALDWSVSWAPSGEIQWASGHSIRVVERGEFGTVSPRDAVERLADWRWGAAPGPDYQGGMTFFAADTSVSSGDARLEGAVSEPPVEPSPPGEQPVKPQPSEEPVAPVEPTEPAEPSEPSEPTEPSEPVVPVEPGEPVEPTEPIEEPSVEPLPVEEPLPTEEPETVTVTIDRAEATLLLMWDVNGNAWLVPGFAVEMPEGWWSGVVSLVEGVITLPEPIDYGVIEPMPIEEPQPIDD